MLIIIGKPNCEYCEKAKTYCNSKELAYEYFDMTDHPTVRNLVVGMGAETVPQIFDGFEHIGGYEELIRYI